MGIRENARLVRERICRAAERANRSPEEVILVGATKTVGVDRIRQAIEAGVKVFGENRVQEAAPKIAQIGNEVEWHFIGHLQRNKVRDAFRLFQMVESVDSLPLALEMEEKGALLGQKMRILVEVNLGGEETKSGTSPELVLELARRMADMPHLSVEGLMSIPPFFSDPEGSRPYFRTLRRLRDEVLSAGIPGIPMRELSMGMTNDFEVAIEEGATIVRIGTALFGPRPS